MRAFKTVALSLCSPLLFACGIDSAPEENIDPRCEDAAAWIMECTGVEAGIEGCDASIAEAAMTMSCEELVDAEGKSDCGFFTPWDCWNFSGGGDDGDDGSSSGEGVLTVSIDECYESYFGGCEAVSSAPCSHVLLLNASGEVVDEGHSSSMGGIRFEGLVEEEQYTVRVMRRDGTVAQMQLDRYADNYGPAELTTTIDRWDATHLNISLQNGERERVTGCARVTVRLNVFEPDGTRVDFEEVEWDWIATYDDIDGAQLSRSHRYYEGPDNSSFTIGNLEPGQHQITYHRVSIPAEPECNWYYIGSELRFGGHSSWYGDECRLPNRDELLLENFAVDDVSPITFTFIVSEDAVGGELETEIYEIIDPVPGQ